MKNIEDIECYAEYGKESVKWFITNNESEIGYSDLIDYLLIKFNGSKLEISKDKSITIKLKK